MIPLHHDPHFTFRFADDRIIPRFRLEGIGPGRRVAVYCTDPATGARLDRLTTGVVGDGNWVELRDPVTVRAGDTFVAVPDDERPPEDSGPATAGAGIGAGDFVTLRPVEPGDLPRMFDLQLDPDSNRMAVTIPRTREAFDAHWAEALADPRVTARAVLVGGKLAGYVSRFPVGGEDHVGYWIDRAFWGQGVASRALQLLLREVSARPLLATAATSNGASMRVLGKCGFAFERVRLSPASDRYPECEEAVFVLW